MTEETREPTTEEKHTTLLLGLILSLRQMALDLLGKGQVEEARGLVDTIETLDVKTKGNTSAEEAKIFEQILYELRMATVTAPGGSAQPDPGETPEPEGEVKEAAGGGEDGS